MKKIFLSILAIAALASCSKSDVIFEQENEIGLLPATKNVTKISGTSGTLADTQELGVWAYWDNDGTVETNVTSYANYNSDYLVNALFAKKSGSWAGSGEAYPWPVNGSLVFAGYTTQTDNVFPLTSTEGATSVSYALSTDEMTFTNYNYDNTTEFDLCWFGRTSASYNYRTVTTNNSVPVTLSHALTWITIKVYGEGTPVDNWTITSMNLKNVVTKGTGTCTGTTTTTSLTNENPDGSTTTTTVVTPATTVWTAVTTTETYPIFNGSTTIDDVDNIKELSNNVIIPSLPLKLIISFTYTVQGQEKTEYKEVDLKLDANNTIKWKSGVHYTYTLKFTGNEILVSPVYGGWDTKNETITVE